MRGSWKVMHSLITMKWKEIQEWNKGMKVHRTDYKSVPFVVTIYGYTFLPMMNLLFHPINEEFLWSFLHPWLHCVLCSIISSETNVLNVPLGKKWKLQDAKSSEYGGWTMCLNFNFTRDSAVARDVCSHALSCYKIVSSVDFYIKSLQIQELKTILYILYTVFTLKGLS